MALEVKWNQYVIKDARIVEEVIGSKPVIDATITSPPYWDLKDYGTKNQIGHQQKLPQYLDDLTQVFSKVWRATKKTGSLWVIIKSIKKTGNLHLLPFALSERLTNSPTCRWYLQDVLIWHKPHTLPWSHKQKLQDHFEYILCFSKSQQFELNIDAVRSQMGITNWWVKYPERYHPAGKSLSNVWEIPIPTQGSWGNGNIEHSCPLPIELAKRVILLTTKKTGTIFDPFAGTGTTAIAAEQLGRKWLATDLNAKYQKMFHQRLAVEGRDETVGNTGIQSLGATNLKLRQLKCAVLLYKRIAPELSLTAEDVPFILVEEGIQQSRARPSWVTNCNIYYVIAKKLDEKKKKQFLSAIAEHKLVPPISKFQIAANIKVVSVEALGARNPFRETEQCFSYTQGRFWNFSRAFKGGELRTVKNSSKFPMVISNIKVQEKPAF